MSKKGMHRQQAVTFGALCCPSSCAFRQVSCQEVKNTELSQASLATPQRGGGAGMGDGLV